MTKTLYTVGDVCSLTGVTRKTLFYYDRVDLLKPTALKGPQNQKLYDAEKLQRMKTIVQYRSAGLTIHEIKHVFEYPEETIQVFKEALKRLEAELDLQQESINTLKRMIDEYSGKEG